MNEGEDEGPPKEKVTGECMPPTDTGPSPRPSPCMCE